MKAPYSCADTYQIKGKNESSWTSLNKSDDGQGLGQDTDQDMTGHGPGQDTDQDRTRQHATRVERRILGGQLHIP